MPIEEVVQLAVALRGHLLNAISPQAIPPIVCLYCDGYTGCFLGTLAAPVTGLPG